MEPKKDVAHGIQPSRNRILKPNRDTLAARWNKKLLRGLDAALAKDPEVDLRLLPSTYSEQLQYFKAPGNRFQYQEYYPSLT